MRLRELPPAMPHAYPGYQRHLAGFKGQVEALSKAAGEHFPEPLACELLYDNFLNLTGPDESSPRLQDVLQPLNFPTDISMLGFAMNWHEKLSDMGENATLHVQIAVHGVSTNEDPPKPFLRINFSARRPVGSWDEVFSFFDGSHEYVRQRFLALTTASAHTIWGLK